MSQISYGMHLLDQVITRTGLRENGCLKDTVILHINHCMDNSFGYTTVLNELSEETVFIGVPYNDMEIDPKWNFYYYYGKKFRNTFEIWSRDGCIRKGLSEFMETVEQCIKIALEERILPHLKEGKKLLIIEDGGYHYPVLHDFLLKYPEYQERVCGSVEQTSSGMKRGIRYCREHGYLYPCSSISRSDIKMNIESRFIGHRIVEELAGFLYTANAFLDFHDILLLGYGIVGRQVAADLDSHNCRISVYDKNREIMKTAVSDGRIPVEEVSREQFRTNTIVIGNTGTASFDEKMLTAFLEGEGERIYLASGSSQDKEFKNYLLMQQGQLDWPQDADHIHHEDREFYSRDEFRYHGKRKLVYLIAEGLPVNFYRKNGISLTYSILDLICSEMLLAGVALHSAPDIAKTMWILGGKDSLPAPFSEIELAELWRKVYGLVEAEDGRSIPRSHPNVDYLRDHILGEI